MISAVLLSWKRPENMPRIVRELQRQPLVGEIVLWNNNSEVTLGASSLGADPRLSVINSPRNFKTLPRYCMVPLARHPHIWLQDDDILVTAEQVEVVWREYQKDTTLIYGVIGRVLAGGRYEARNAPPGRCDEVIRAQLLHRSQVSPMLAALPTVHWEPGEVDDAEDDLYLNLTRGLGRAVVVDVGPVKDLHLRGHNVDGIARWRRPDHLKRRQEAVDDILERLPRC